MNTQELVPMPGWGPPSPTALVANVTVTRSVGPGVLTLWPSDSSRPLVSNLNFRTP